MKLKLSSLKIISVRILAVLSLFLLISGCRNLEGPELWPLQDGSTDIVKYYDGDTRPLHELAVLHVREPYCIVHEGRNFRKSFALKPGYHQILVSYFRYNAYGAVTESLEPVAMDFVVEPGHVYRFFHTEYEERIERENSPDIWAPYLVDITNDRTLTDAINNCPFPSIKKEIVWLFSDSSQVAQILQNQKDAGVREASRLKLIRMVNVETFVLKFPTIPILCDALNEITDTEFIGEIFIHYRDLPAADCAKSRLAELSEAKAKKKSREYRVKKSATGKINWLKHNGMW